VSFDDWWDRCLALDARLEQLASDDSLPERPDVGRIEEWSVSTHLGWWTGR